MKPVTEKNLEEAARSLIDSITYYVPEFPDSKDKLFVSCHDFWELNACIYKSENLDAYADGYLDAAKLLSRIVIHSGRGMDTLIYPMIFLYRHYLELKLKKLIRIGADITGEEISADLEETLSGHNLMKLWNHFKPSFLEVCGHESDFNEVRKGVESYINQIHSIDPESITFRYDRSKDQKKHNLQEFKHINVLHFYEAIEKLTTLIEGIESEFLKVQDYCDEMKANYLSE